MTAHTATNVIRNLVKTVTIHGTGTVQQRSIYLPAIDKRVSLGAYVKAVKAALANPAVEFKHGLTCWWPCKGSEIGRQFLAGVHDRINQSVPYSQRGK